MGATVGIGLCHRGEISRVVENHGWPLFAAADRGGFGYWLTTFVVASRFTPSQLRSEFAVGSKVADLRDLVEEGDHFIATNFRGAKAFSINSTSGVTTSLTHTRGASDGVTMAASPPLQTALAPAGGGDLHGHTSQLTAQDKADLVEYLKSR